MGNSPVGDVLPQGTLSIACSLKRFVVEEVRTARRILSAYGLKGHIDSLEFHELNEHTRQDEVEALLPLFDNGDVGYMSEAGLPAVADPGSALVALCHREGIEVIPLVGPSSLMMALMASGLNGQSFAFCGYVPAKADERKGALKDNNRDPLPQRRPARRHAPGILPFHENLPRRRHLPTYTIYQDRQRGGLEKDRDHNRQAPLRVHSACLTPI